MNYSSYRTKIGAWLEKHPVVGLPVHIISYLFEYMTSFKWVIDIVRWMVTTAGNIAESAFLLATVYVTTNTVAHPLVTWILPAQTIMTLNQISTMAFSVLPELIIASAMKTTFDHWKLVWRSPKRIDAWIWACSYTIPTLVFLVMTILTISTFVNFEAVNATPPQATGGMLVTRCLAGWGYGMVQILFVSIGKQGYVEAMDDLHAQIHSRDEALAERETTIQVLQEEMVIRQEEIAQQEQELFKARMALATSKATRGKSSVSFQREGTKPRSAVHMLKKDGEQRENTIGNTSALHEDVYSDVNRELESDADKEQERITKGNTSALNSDVSREQDRDQTANPNGQSQDVNKELNEDVNSDQDRELNEGQIENKSALKEDVNSDVDREQRVHTRGNTTAFKKDLYSDQDRELTEEQTRISIGNKQGSKTKADASEAAKKIHRILRRNPNTGPTELATKVGVSRRYASQVKSQFLASLLAEQSA